MASVNLDQIEAQIAAHPENEAILKFEHLEHEISSIEDLVPVKGKFRLSSKRFILTYKSHIDKNKYITWLKKKASCSVWLAHETGDKINNYNHTHVLIDFVKRVDWTSPTCLDFDSKHPNIKKILTTDHWNNCVSYMCKEDKSNLDLLALAEKLEDGIADWIWKSPTIHDALRKCESVQEASGVKVLWDNKPKNKFTFNYNLEHSWQLKLEEEIKSKPSHRSIIWYYDKIGNTGKTMMANYLQEHHDAIVLRQISSTKDCATIMESFVNNEWKGNIIAIDFTRSADSKSIYDCLECLKDGNMTATKYHGAILNWNKPHVIVFANFKPDFRRLSYDRIDFRDITPTHKIVSPHKKSSSHNIKLHIKKKNKCPHCKLCSQCSSLSLTIESSDDELSITVSSSSDSDS